MMNAAAAKKRSAVDKIKTVNKKRVDTHGIWCQEM
jgi:hypothetical protein